MKTLARTDILESHQLTFFLNFSPQISNHSKQWKILKDSYDLLFLGLPDLDFCQDGTVLPVFCMPLGQKKIQNFRNWHITKKLG